MFIGGYSGSVNNVSLDELKQMVENGEITYIYLGGGGRGGLSSNGTSAATDISSWVQENLTAVDGVSGLYTLS